MLRSRVASVFSEAKGRTCEDAGLGLQVITIDSSVSQLTFSAGTGFQQTVCWCDGKVQAVIVIVSVAHEHPMTNQMTSKQGWSLAIQLKCGQHQATLTSMRKLHSLEACLPAMQLAVNSHELFCFQALVATSLGHSKLPSVISKS